jgi:hypothetical protein
MSNACIDHRKFVQSELEFGEAPPTPPPNYQCRGRCPTLSMWRIELALLTSRPLNLVNLLYAPLCPLLIANHVSPRSASCNPASQHRGMRLTSWRITALEHNRSRGFLFGESLNGYGESVRARSGAINGEGGRSGPEVVDAFLQQSHRLEDGLKHRTNIILEGIKGFRNFPRRS